MSQEMESLKKQGVAMVPYSTELRELVEAAAQDWQQFCTLPLEQKIELSDIGPMVGYEFKDNHEPGGDRKENFDITNADTLGTMDLEAAHPFMKKAAAISGAMKHLAIQFASDVEDAYKIPHLRDLAEASTDQIFTRFIHYFGDRTPGDEIASTHCDQSGYTFHLFETAGGCQRLDYTTRQWEEMPVETGMMAAFPAMQLQLVSEGELRALAHRVVATEETRDVGRYAIVCFVRLRNTPEYDKASHGRLQEFEPGFNYDMPIEDFSKLFN